MSTSQTDSSRCDQRELLRYHSNHAEYLTPYLHTYILHNPSIQPATKQDTRRYRANTQQVDWSHATSPSPRGSRTQTHTRHICVCAFSHNRVSKTQDSGVRTLGSRDRSQETAIDGRQFQGGSTYSPCLTDAPVGSAACNPPKTSQCLASRHGRYSDALVLLCFVSYGRRGRCVQR